VAAARAPASFGGEQVGMEGGQKQESKGVCSLNRRRRRRIRHGTAGLAEKETEEEAKWNAARGFSAITENTGTLL
jgi:hypothetical protein